SARVDLGEWDYVQFRILISAERSARVATRTGRLVLRGTSPSARLLAHRDLTTPVSPGAIRDAAARVSDATMTGHVMEHGSMPAGAWRKPPLPPPQAVRPRATGLPPAARAFSPACP